MSDLTLPVMSGWQDVPAQAFAALRILTPIAESLGVA